MPTLVKIGPVVLEKKIFNSCQFIFINSRLSPLWEGRGPSFEQTWIPFTQGYFVPSLVEIGPVVLEKKMKMWKVYKQTDRRTDRRTDGQRDDGQQVIRKAHLSFQLRWAKKEVRKLEYSGNDTNTDNDINKKMLLVHHPCNLISFTEPVNVKFEGIVLNERLFQDFCWLCPLTVSLWYNRKKNIHKQFL